MNQIPPPVPSQTKTDKDHLRLLAVFHFLWAGMAVLALVFLLLHYCIMNAVVNNDEMWKKSTDVSAREFFMMFRWFYLCFGIFLVAAGIANLFSGLFILRIKHRIFSLIMAGINCLQFPFGTCLGVFTFVVLLRESVRESYESQRP